MSRWRAALRGAPSSRSWFATPDGVLGATTVAVGVAIAAAPLLGTVPVAICAVAWFVAVPIVVAVRLVGARRRWTIGTGVGCLGVTLAGVRMAALGLVRLFDDRPALIWNVDWRYHVTQAYGIARFGGLDDSLDFAGRPVGYHAGPAWIGGALQRTIDAPVDIVMFLVLPLVAVPVVALGALGLLRTIGVTRDAAFLTVGVAVGVATAPLSLVGDVVRGDPGAFLDAESWLFTPSVMLNSLLALAIGLVALWMVVSARTWPRAVVGAAGLASLAAIKPQYLVGFVAVLGLGFAATRVRAGRWRELGLVAVVVAGGALACAAVTPQDTSFTAVTIDVFHGLRDGVRDHELLLVALVATVVLLAVPTVRRSQDPTLIWYAAGGAVGAAALFGFLYDVVFLLDEEDVARARATGLALTRTAYQYDFQQALVPVALVLVLMVAAIVFGALGARSARAGLGAAIVAGAVIALTVPFAIAQVAAPTGRAAYEWTEERDLRALFRAVDVDRGRWVSSDLADPADDFDRPLRATNLTALGEAQFWVSNVDYGGWTQPDGAARVRALQRFFATPWSPAHDEFLRANAIHYVLVSDRCPATWDPADFPGAVVGVRGRWTLLEVGARSRPGAMAPRPWPEPTRDPLYGRGACRSGERQA